MWLGNPWERKNNFSTAKNSEIAQRPAVDINVNAVAYFVDTLVFICDAEQQNKDSSATSLFADFCAVRCSRVVFVIPENTDAAGARPITINALYFSRLLHLNLIETYMKPTFIRVSGGRHTGSDGRKDN